MLTAAKGKAQAEGAKAGDRNSRGARLQGGADSVAWRGHELEAVGAVGGMR